MQYGNHDKNYKTQNERKLASLASQVHWTGERKSYFIANWVLPSAVFHRFHRSPVIQNEQRPQRGQGAAPLRTKHEHEHPACSFPSGIMEGWS